MLRRLFERTDTPPTGDLYDILRSSAGPASRRFNRLMSAGRRPTMVLVDRVADEKERQAFRFLDAIAANVGGRALYAGADIYAPEGTAPVYVYATAPEAFRDAEHWLLASGGTLLPRYEQHRGGYSCNDMHSMVMSETLILLDEPANDHLGLRWSVAAGESVGTVVLSPMGMAAHAEPNQDSPVRTVIEVGSEVQFVDFFSDDWALLNSSDGEMLGWVRHSLSDTG